MTATSVQPSRVCVPCALSQRRGCGRPGGPGAGAARRRALAADGAGSRRLRACRRRRRRRRRRASAAHAAACDALAALLEAGGAANARLAGPVARALDGVLRASRPGAEPRFRLRRAEAGRRRRRRRPPGCHVRDDSRRRVPRRGGGGARARPRVRRGRARAVRRAAAASDAAVRLGIDPTGIRRENRIIVHEKSFTEAISQRRPKKTRAVRAARGVAPARTRWTRTRLRRLVDRRGSLAAAPAPPPTQCEAALDALEAIVTSGADAPRRRPHAPPTLRLRKPRRAFLAATASGPGPVAARVRACPRRCAPGEPRAALLLASTLAPRPFRATNCLWRRPCSAPLRSGTRAPTRGTRGARRRRCCTRAPPLHPRAIAPPRDLTRGWSPRRVRRRGLAAETARRRDVGGRAGTQRRAAPAGGRAGAGRLERRGGGASDDDASRRRRRRRRRPPSSPAVAPTKRGDERTSRPPRVCLPRSRREDAKRSEAEGGAFRSRALRSAFRSGPRTGGARGARRGRARPSPNRAGPKPKRQTARLAAAAKAAAGAAAGGGGASRGGGQTESGRARARIGKSSVAPRSETTATGSFRIVDE